MVIGGSPLRRLAQSSAAAAGITGAASRPLKKSLRSIRPPSGGRPAPVSLGVLSDLTACDELYVVADFILLGHPEHELQVGKRAARCWAEHAGDLRRGVVAEQEFAGHFRGRHGL